MMQQALSLSWKKGFLFNRRWIFAYFQWEPLALLVPPTPKWCHEGEEELVCLERMEEEGIHYSPWMERLFETARPQGREAAVEVVRNSNTEAAPFTALIYEVEEDSIHFSG